MKFIKFLKNWMDINIFQCLKKLWNVIMDVLAQTIQMT